MHLAIALFIIYAAWRLSDWRNWRKYHATMLYITSGGLLYEYLTEDYNLWIFHPDFLYNQTITIIVYAVMTMPLSVLIFLSKYPSNGWKKQLIYILKWVLIYAFVELALQLFGRISYKHGWNFWYSVLFDVMMFPMLRLHYLKPLWAYLISIIIIIILISWFHVPLD
ncbi:MAG: hypothetical protein JWM44_2782 [Bacilli bacterium]|nr:hypothetical protein [Bacilli bacterium]